MINANTSRNELLAKMSAAGPSKNNRQAYFQF